MLTSSYLLNYLPKSFGSAPLHIIQYSRICSVCLCKTTVPSNYFLTVPLNLRYSSLMSPIIQSDDIIDCINSILKWTTPCQDISLIDISLFNFHQINDRSWIEKGTCFRCWQLNFTRLKTSPTQLFLSFSCVLEQVMICQSSSVINLTYSIHVHKQGQEGTEKWDSIWIQLMSQCWSMSCADRPVTLPERLEKEGSFATTSTNFSDYRKQVLSDVLHIFLWA